MDRPMNINDASLYADVQAVQSLKQGQSMNTKAGLEKVAKEFESIYLKMMLDSMRAAEKIWAEDNPFSSQETQFFRDMLDGQLTKDLSNSNSIGLADLLVEQYQHLLNERSEPSVLNQQAGVAQPSPQLPSEEPGEHKQVKDFKSNQQPIPEYKAQTETVSFKTPDDFVQGVWQYAEKAANALQVPTGVLVAQAALETGWGKSLETSKTLNLFGIKDSKSWSGQQQVLPTSEFIDGQWQKQQQAFRSYDSLEQSFEDYVSLIQSQNRYASALESKTPEDYAQALQASGYATDPKYAEKILSIYQSSRIQTFEQNLAHKAFK